MNRTDYIIYPHYTVVLVTLTTQTFDSSIILCIYKKKCQYFLIQFQISNFEKMANNNDLGSKL